MTRFSRNEKSHRTQQRLPFRTVLATPSNATGHVTIVAALARLLLDAAKQKARQEAADDVP